MRHRIFLDSSALFAAIYSKSGGARELVRMAIQGEIQIVVSQDVLDETIRNLNRKAPDKVSALKKLFVVLDLEISPDPTQKELEKTEAYVVQKDAPIIAAMRKANVEFFVTLDKKHLLGNPALEGNGVTAIGTPLEALSYLRERM